MGGFFRASAALAAAALVLGGSAASPVLTPGPLGLDPSAAGFCDSEAGPGEVNSIGIDLFTFQPGETYELLDVRLLAPVNFEVIGAALVPIDPWSEDATTFSGLVAGYPPATERNRERWELAAHIPGVIEHRGTEPRDINFVVGLKATDVPAHAAGVVLEYRTASGSRHLVQFDWMLAAADTDAGCDELFDLVRRYDR